MRAGPFPPRGAMRARGGPSFFLSWRGAPAALAALALLAGCAGGGAARYRTLDDAWQRADAKAASPSAGDGASLFAGDAILRREALVEAVLRRNPTLRAARYAWRAALERYPQVTALADPMLSGGVAPRSFGSSRVNDAGSVQLSQALPFPGKLELRGQVALAEAEAASQDFAAVRLRLATMASLLLDGYALAERSLAINEEHEALLEELRQVALARYQAGTAAQQDPLQAEVELARALRREAELDTRRRIAVQQLNALLHRPAELPLPPPPAPRPAPDELPDAEQLARGAADARPELRAADARVEAREAQVALARREFLPDFTVLGAYNAVMQEEDLQPFVGLGLNLPLQLGRRRAALAQARAELERARSERAALADGVQVDVRSGVDRLREALRVEALYVDRLVPAARDQVVAARAGFETGSNSFLAVVDAERNLLDAELGLEEARVDTSRQRAELDRAVGRIPGLPPDRRKP